MNRSWSGGRRYLLNFNFVIIFGALILIILLKAQIVIHPSNFSIKEGEEDGIYYPFLF
jgi:hypothetical protein